MLYVFLDFALLLLLCSRKSPIMLHLFTQQKPDYATLSALKEQPQLRRKNCEHNGHQPTWLRRGLVRASYPCSVVPVRNVSPRYQIPGATGCFTPGISCVWPMMPQSTFVFRPLSPLKSRRITIFSSFGECL